MQVRTFVLRTLMDIDMYINSMDTEQMRNQTLKWVSTVPRHKLNASKMVMVITDGIPKFVPKHLVKCDQGQ